ncbi:hypothetical protein PGT21_033625 [Puccinia graminis f. sp. tritici]|uniref:Uncharacterized protein n=1 Tax=Puccinia graminis f. sp. tritici TaxID=56615 RepID=A0A5B0N7H8_PUCGR|nr:hypothetical protein PGTUg99_007339 [Puccinia graminis f. sp. tritici]KAA1084656.1 hypothetical protein PGT21_033625 [Puccinia graminis f. sp. tritici]
MLSVFSFSFHFLRLISTHNDKNNFEKGIYDNHQKRGFIDLFFSFSQSYLIVTVVVGSLLELMGLLISHSIMGYRAIPSGPFMVTFAIVYQHHAIVPSLYDYRIGRVHLDSHSLVPDILSLLLGLFNPLSSLVGILVGALYRTDQLGLARWRLRNSFLLSRLTSRSSDRRRKPRPTHASLEDDPRFEATIAPSRSSL